MSAKTTIYGTWNEDGTATIQGRVIARDGTGAPVAGEGRAVKQADLSTVTIKVFNISADPPTESYTATLTIASVIFDSLQTDATWVPGVDSTGFNFSVDIPASAFPTGDQKYRAEVKYTTTGGSVGWGRWQGLAVGVATS
jgi:hypothetical protein